MPTMHQHQRRAVLSGRSPTANGERLSGAILYLGITPARICGRPHGSDVIRC
jgi:hypothetical protein